MATPLFGFTVTAASGYNLLIPSDITGLVIWLDSSDSSSLSLSGTNVLSWTDKATSKVFTPTTASTYGTRSSPSTGINFPNAGSGTGTYGLGYSTTWYLPTQNFSVFVVYKPTASATFNAAFGLTTSNNLATSGRPNFFFVAQYGTGERTRIVIDYDGASFASEVTSSDNGSVGLNVIHVDEIIMTNSSSTTKIYTNGTENTYAAGPSNYTSSYSNYPVGNATVAANATAWGSRSFTGVVYETVVYNRSITSNERTNLENYFYLKWRFSPTDYSSNVYWFDAADSSTITTSGSTVTAWANKGTATMTYSANTGTVTLATNSLNGRNTIRFPTGSKLVSQSVNLAITGNDETIFVVYQKRANLTTGSIELMTANNPNPGGNPSGFDLYYNSIIYGKDLTSNTNYYDLFWTVCGGYCFTSGGNTPTYSPYVYQLLSLVVSQTSPGFWSFGGNNNGVGSGPGQRYAGCGNGYSLSSMTFNMGKSSVDWDIAEYIVYNRVLTNSERQTVEGYLSIKWGIPLDPSHPYYSKITTTSLSQDSLAIWLDSADYSTFSLSGTNVLSWTDKVGGKTFTPRSASTYPTRADSSSGVFFPNGGLDDGGSYGLAYDTQWILPTQNFSVFAVYKPTTTSTYNFAVGMTGKTGAFDLPQLDVNIRYGSFYKSSCGLDKNSYYASFVMASSNGGIGANTIRLDEIIMGSTTTTTKIFTNGVESSYQNAPDDYTSPYTNYAVNHMVLGTDLGNAFSGSLTGNIYEVLVYNKTLTSPERVKVETYLKSKWSIY